MLTIFVGLHGDSSFTSELAEHKDDTGTLQVQVGSNLVWVCLFSLADKIDHQLLNRTKPVIIQAAKLRNSAVELEATS